MKEMTKPIRPSDIAAAKEKYIPVVVFEIFNKLIANNYTGNKARVYQKEVTDALTSEPYNIERNLIFDNGWLNVEEAYRSAGWTVYYDSPGFNESYDAYFIFTKAENT